MSAAPQRGFGEAEYRHRLSRAQTMMAKAGPADLFALKGLNSLKLS